MKINMLVSLNDYKLVRRPGNIRFFSCTFTILLMKVFHFHSFVITAVALFYR